MADVDLFLEKLADLMEDNARADGARDRRILAIEHQVGASSQ